MSGRREENKLSFLEATGHIDEASKCVMPEIPPSGTSKEIKEVQEYVCNTFHINKKLEPIFIEMGMVKTIMGST